MEHKLLCSSNSGDSPDAELPATQDACSFKLLSALMTPGASKYHGIVLIVTVVVFYYI